MCWLWVLFWVLFFCFFWVVVFRLLRLRLGNSSSIILLLGFLILCWCVLCRFLVVWLLVICNWWWISKVRGWVVILYWIRCWFGFWLVLVWWWIGNLMVFMCCVMFGWRVFVGLCWFWLFWLFNIVFRIVWVMVVILL